MKKKMIFGLLVSMVVLIGMMSLQAATAGSHWWDKFGEPQYGGTVDGIPHGVISSTYRGWYFPYDEWPQKLKDVYSYNPTRAKQLLAEAGYPEGFKTNCVVKSNADVELTQIVKAYFSNTITGLNYG